MHDRVAIAAILLVSASAGLWAQTIRRESSLSLPTGISVAPPAAVSPKGSFVVASCSDDVVRLWSLPSGDLARSLDTKADPVTALRLSSDGHVLAMAATSGAIKIWDVVSWKVQQEMSAPSFVSVFAISPDNHFLAAATDYDVYIWDLGKHERVAASHVPFGWSWSLAFSPDGSLLASADGDTAIRVYNARTWNLRSTTSDLLLESLALDFSSDGKSLFVGGADKTISVIDPLTGKIRGTLPKQSGTLRGLIASSDGKQIAAIYNLPDRFDEGSISVVLLWDIGVRAVRTRFEQPGIAVLGGAFVGGRFFLVGGAGNKLSIWSMQ